MKTEFKILLFCLLAGCACWTLDAAAEAVEVGGEFWDHAFLQVPWQRLVMRLLSVVIFLGFGGSMVRAMGIHRQDVAAASASDARLVTTLRSIGDAVITIDIDRRVTFMNQVARDLTGWDDEAIGRPMDAVFKIVNSQTREPAVNPVDKVLREGVIVGLANHTVLIDRNGKEYQISDSAAPIRDDKGEIFGVVLVFRDVTAAYEKDRRLRQSERRYRSMFESLGEGFSLHEIICDEDGRPCDYRFLEVNPAFEAFTGLRHEDIVGKTVLEVLPGTEPFWIDTFGKVALTGEAVRVEEFSGELNKHFEVIGYSPAVGQFATLFVDVTAKRQGERRIAKLNAVLRSIRDVSQLIAQTSDQQELLDRVCEKLVSEDGYYAAWIGLRDDERRLTPASEAGAVGVFDPLRAGLAENPHLGCWAQAEAGDLPPVTTPDTGRCEGCPMTLRDPARVAMCARLVHGSKELGVLVVTIDRSVSGDAEQRELFEEVASDIALALYKMDIERRGRHTSQMLTRTEELFSMVLARSFDGICFAEFDPASKARKLVFCNDRYVEMSGRSREELAAAEDMNSFARFVNNDCIAFDQPAEGLPGWGTSSWIRPDGKENYFEWTATKVTFEGAEYLISIDRDVTARLRAEQELLAERDRAQHYLDVVKVVLVALDAGGKVTLINRMGCEVLGLEEQEIIGKSWFEEFVAPAYREADLKAFVMVVTGQRHSIPDCDSKVVAADGSERIISWKFDISRDENGYVIGLLGSGQDVTEQIQTAEQLRQAQKMEAIGRLAGGIAHDFNNQLTVVQGYCDLLFRQSSQDEETLECVGHIRDAAVRAATLTRQLLVYSRKHVLRSEAVSINGLLKDMTGPLARMIGEDIRLSLNLAEDAPDVKSDPVQLQQAIMNMAVNARDAMPAGGELVISTATAGCGEPAIERHPDSEGNAYVKLTVRDTGVGMDDRTREMLFEPFYTTKPTGQGTGLGLAMVYGFVQQCDGHIEVESIIGQGTTFSVYLPIFKAADESASLVEAEPASTLWDTLPGGGETILVTEDERAVRAFLVQVLQGCGYNVLAAADAAEASALVERHGDRIDLLVTDVIMPGETGAELAHRLADRVPEMGVLFVSGYAADSATNRSLPKLNGPLLRKPFGPKELAAAVRDVLDENASAGEGCDDA